MLTVYAVWIVIIVEWKQKRRERVWDYTCSSYLIHTSFKNPRMVRYVLEYMYSSYQRQSLSYDKQMLIRCYEWIYMYELHKSFGEPC